MSTRWRIEAASWALAAFSALAGVASSAAAQSNEASSSAGTSTATTSAAAPGAKSKAAEQTTSAAASDQDAADGDAADSARGHASETEAAAANPHGANPHAGAAMGHAPRVRDRVEAAPDLPPGTIEVHIRDHTDAPLADQQVRLHIVHSTVAEGQSKHESVQQTDAEGRTVFTGQVASLAVQYQIEVRSGEAAFATFPFQLKEEHGERVTLHVFPVSRDPAGIVGARGIIAIHPRDDVFTVEMLYQIYNVGNVAWVPQGISLSLPTGWKGFETEESTTDRRFVDEGNSVSLQGTYPPGQHEVSFRFRLENEQEPTRVFRFAVLPQLFDLRVIAESTQNMEMSVTGFNPAEGARGMNGQRLLVASKNFMRSRERNSGYVSVRLSGMPQPSTGRIWASLIAICTAAFGIWFATSRDARKGAKQKLPSAASADAKRARKLLLDELVELERAKLDKQIGPRTYQRTKQLLLDSLARVEALLATPPSTQTN